MRSGDGIAIAVLAGVVHVHRQPRQPLDHVLAGQGGMPTGAAGGDVDASTRRQFFVGNLHLAEKDLAGVQRDAAQRGVADGARLLPDFLEHEVLVAAFFRLDRIPLDARELALDGLAVEVGQLHAPGREDGHVAIGEKVDIARVVQNAGHVGGDKDSPSPTPMTTGGPERAATILSGSAAERTAQRKCAGEALDGAAHRIFQRDRRAGGFGILLHLLDQVGDDLGVGLGDELVALRGELALQLQIVFHDAVVDDDDAARAVAMRVGVLFGGAAMGGPAGVADAEGALKGMLAQHLLQVVQLARSAADLKRALAGSADGDARRVVAAILQAPQPLEDEWHNFLRADITHDSAHTTIVCGAGRATPKG